MMRLKKSHEPNSPAGAPRWIVTFSDCMTLLLTFFVLLLSYCSFGTVGPFKNLKSAFSEEFSISPNDKQGNAILAGQVQKQEGPQKGSEKATLSAGLEDNLKKEDISTNFRDRKIFIIPSEEIFLGKGAYLSIQGKKKLADMAAFLKEVPNRIVISENLQGNSEDSDMGLQRAWALMDHFAKIHGLDRQRFSISAGSTLADENTPSDTKNRRIEIVLLERSIYN
jgi:chemotaxis protein MotB